MAKHTEILEPAIGNVVLVDHTHRPRAGEKVASSDHRFDTATVSLGQALPFGLGRPLRVLRTFR